MGLVEPLFEFVILGNLNFFLALIVSKKNERADRWQNFEFV
jgi:hypothetical protein